MYNKIIVHGDSYVDFIWSRHNMFDETEIDEIVSKGVQNPVWTHDTNLLATFSNESINGNPLVEQNTISKYIIQREKVGYKNKVEVATTNSPIITDYGMRATSEYKYSIIPVFVDEENSTEVYGETTNTEAIKVELDGVYMMGLLPTSKDNSKYMIDKNNIWHFTLDIDGIEFKGNNTKTYDTDSGRFPIENNTKTKFVTFPISTLLGTVDCKGRYINDNIDTLEKWQKFCDSDNLKLFKDSFGNVYPCNISNHSEKTEYIYTQPRTLVNFDVTQLADIDNISVYGEEDI